MVESTIKSLQRFISIANFTAAAAGGPAVANITRDGAAWLFYCNPTTPPLFGTGSSAASSAFLIICRTLAAKKRTRLCRQKLNLLSISRKMTILISLLEYWNNLDSSQVEFFRQIIFFNKQKRCCCCCRKSFA